MTLMKRMLKKTRKKDTLVANVKETERMIKSISKNFLKYNYSGD